MYCRILQLCRLPPKRTRVDINVNTLESKWVNASPASLFCLCLCFKLASTYRVQLVNAHGLFRLTTLRCWLSASGSKRVWKKFIKQSNGMFSFSFPERESLTHWAVDFSCQYRGMSLSDEWWVEETHVGLNSWGRVGLAIDVLGGGLLSNPESTTSLVGEIFTSNSGND